MDDPIGDSGQFSNHVIGQTVTNSRLFTSTLLFGTCAGWMFISFIFVQAFTYFRHYKKDSKFLKSIVILAILIQLLETGTESYVVYAVDSAGWGDPLIITHPSVYIVDDTQSMYVPITSFIVQCFFIWRIWTFSMAFILHNRIKMLSRIVCAVIALGSVVSLASALTLATAILAIEAVQWWEETALVIWNISSAAVDVSITICMMALLLHARASSCFGETRDMLSRLMRNVLQTGLLTSILALLVLPLFYRNLNGVYGLPWYILGKSEVISLLASLNARRRSNVSVVHGSDSDQAIPQASRMSTMVFQPRRTERGGGNIATDVSFPVQSVSQTESHSQVQIQSNKNLNRDVSEEYNGGPEKESSFNAA